MRHNFIAYASLNGDNHAYYLETKEEYEHTFITPEDFLGIIMPIGVDIDAGTVEPNEM